MNYRTREELDKIAEDLAIEMQNEQIAKEACTLIEEGLMKLATATLINNGVEDIEKVASEEGMDSLLQLGAHTYSLIKQAEADAAWEEADKEAHDLFHEAFSRGYEEAMKEAGFLGNIAGGLAAAGKSIMNVSASMISSLKAMLQKLINSPGANPQAKAQAQKLLNAGDQAIAEFIKKNPQVLGV